LSLHDALPISLFRKFQRFPPHNILTRSLSGSIKAGLPAISNRTNLKLSKAHFSLQQLSMAGHRHARKISRRDFWGAGRRTGGKAAPPSFGERLSIVHFNLRARAASESPLRTAIAIQRFWPRQVPGPPFLIVFDGWQQRVTGMAFRSQPGD